LKTAHCARCHTTFTTVSNFDRHRPGTCLPPTEIGLVVLRKHGDTPIWGQPGLPENADFRRDVFTETGEQMGAGKNHWTPPIDRSETQ